MDSLTFLVFEKFIPEKWEADVRATFKQSMQICEVVALVVALIFGILAFMMPKSAALISFGVVGLVIASWIVAFAINKCCRAEPPTP